MATIVPRLYSNFRGVDFRGEEINLIRSPDAKNMWKNYKKTSAIETRPGLKMVDRSLCELALSPMGIYFYKDKMLVHASNSLFSYKDGVLKQIYSDCGIDQSNGFVYENVFYFMDGENYMKYDGEKFERVEGYIPTTSIARKPEGGGSKYEDINMLSDYRYNTFLSDGGSFDFYLDSRNLDTDYVPEVWLSDVLVDKSEYTVDYTEGKITFTYTAPDAPLTDGQDNIRVKFKKSVPGYRDAILKCTLIQLFDNRVFFSGNPDRPNVVWHCSLNDPSYVSDLDYYREGLDSAPIRGMVAGNNALWVFREPSDANTTVFYHTPTLDEEYGKIYPSTHSSVTTGCVGRAINFNDDIVFFSDRGMEGISGDVTTEQMVAHRSSVVDRKLTAEEGYKDMILAEWEGYLMVFIGKKVYLADSRAMYTNDNHNEYEWFYWELDKTVTCATVNEGVLYIGTTAGIYTLTDMEAEMECYWTTPLDKFDNPNRLKTTNKRGCVVEAEGDISVYAKLEDTDFELIGEYKNVTDYFVSRIKRKKFKDIKLKFYSQTRFRLETITLEAFIGGYIKR